MKKLKMAPMNIIYNVENHYSIIYGRFKCNLCKSWRVNKEGFIRHLHLKHPDVFRSLVELVWRRAPEDNALLEDISLHNQQ